MSLRTTHIMHTTECITKYLAKLLLSLLSLITIAHAEMSKDALEEWFESDNFQPPSLSTATDHINSGELAFLTDIPNKPFHHHENTVTLTPDSLQSGWIHLQQCHYNLDAVSKLQIAFKKGHVRNIVITDTQNIGKAWTEKDSVQLENVKNNAKICLNSETLSLRTQTDGTLTLNNGPYMRRFFDGYYPMQVTMTLKYPAETISLINVHPQAQPGFRIRKTPGSVTLNAVFEGELRTVIHLNKHHKRGTTHPPH